ncbi:calcium permeable stress-gated cation channel [Entomortierella parvispora]|uniref:Calcium permeable stress-gated cation channel n=1 Tax=Entomortierella parvispora TaxID=205924 RepID=A0A9P3H3V5_9FUNG|nr:calcium permeable stress-gated cation channel [Entomortierella parvispora]
MEDHHLQFLLREQTFNSFPNANGTLVNTTSAGDANAAKNVSGLTTQLVISISLGLAAFLAFCFLRTRWVVMFAPRSKLRRHTPPILSSTFFGWIPQLLRIPEAEVLDCVGLDAVMLLRFCSMALKLFSCCLIPGLLIIMPVNNYSAKVDPVNGGNSTTGAPNSPDALKQSLLYLFTQFTFTWVFSLVALYSIWQTYEGYITIRRKYMLSRAKSITNRTVMVIGLPTHLQTDRSLATFYESLGTGQVESAHVVRHVRALKRLVQQRAHALRQLELVYTRYYGNPSGVPGYDPEKIEAEFSRTAPPSRQATMNENSNESTSLLGSPAHFGYTIPGKPRPTMRLGLWGIFGKKVDKIDQCSEIFATLDKAVQKMRLSRIFASTSVGFVTFEDMNSAQILAQTVNTQETLSCETTLAPEPRDVFWDNLNLPPSELGVRSVVVNTTVFFLIFFWAGPVGVFSSFLNLDSLEKLIPGVSVIAEASPILKQVIQGFLPTLGVVVFLAVVPKILEALCEQQGIQSHSAVARSIYNKYFTFILFNVVLVFTIVGTWAQAVDKVYHNIGELTLILATSLPRVAPFFINYIILKGIGMFPLQLLQIGDVFVQTFHGILSRTPRDYAEARAPPELNHGVVYSNATLVFVIILIYSCLRPLILFFGLIYFALAYLVLKYQLLYVFFHPYESNGQTWPMVYNRITLGLLIFQLTALGLFVLQQSYLLAALMIPLPVGTIWFWVWTTRAYRNSAEFVPLELLRPEDVDAHLQPYNANTSQENGASNNPAVATSTTPVPGHVLIQVDPASGKSNGKSAAAASSGGNLGGHASVASTTSVITPGGTQRLIPKSAVEEDDYQAIPDRYTDYRQPPMTLYDGILNSGMRHYNHPAVAGPLPTLWLPLKKGTPSNVKPDFEVGAGRDHDSDSDDEHHLHEHVESALARPPLMLPSQTSDEPQSYDEGDNLVGGGQDEDLSSPTDGRENSQVAAAAASASTATTTSTPHSRGPQRIPSKASATPSTATTSTATPAAESETVTNRAITGVNEIYYHHPERQGSGSTNNTSNVQDAATLPSGEPTQRLRTVQGQGSVASLDKNRGSAMSTTTDHN